jgi:Bacteriophage baseplate protein W
MVFQVLFTSPGERVNRPDFGCGLLDLVFAPNSEARAAATQLLVHGSLQRWLSDVVRIENVRIENVDASLEVEVSYTRLMDGERLEARFTAPTPGAAP